MVSIGFAVSFGFLFYSISINQPISYPETWTWQAMVIAPYNSPESHFSVATFSFPKENVSALAIQTDVNVDFKSIILSQDSVFISFNWTGGNWTLKFGFQIKL
jgi:hypothetical protein